MSPVYAEMRQGWRAIRQQPASAVLIVGLLALGLACVIAIASIIKTTMLDPLPFPAADRLHRIGWVDPLQPSENPEELLGAEFLQWQTALHGTAELAAAQTGTVNLTTGDAVTRFDGAYISANLFAMLKLAPMLGRDFRPEDDRPGAPLVVILSESVWRTRFAADPAVLGRTLRANGETATIVGVMPPDFTFPVHEAVWLPARLDPNAPPASDRSLGVFLSLPPHTALDAVRMPLQRWLADSARSQPHWAQRELSLQSLAHFYTDADTRSILGLMLVTVALVLLVACANAANLMLVRTLARSRDLVIRLTLGATRWRIAVYLLSQSLLLTVLALLAALPLANWGVHWVLGRFGDTGEGPPAWMHFGVDAQMSGLAMALALATAVVVALIPVLKLRTQALAEPLRDGGRGVIGAGDRVSRWMVAGELSLACVVLLATLVMVRAVSAMERADLGINPERLLTARVGVFPAQYPSDADVAQFFERLTTALAADPAVEAAAAGSALPGLSADEELIAPEGYDAGERSYPRVRMAAVDPNYTLAYGIELRSGRGFSSADSADSDPVVIVDERYARTFSPDGQVLGRRVRIPADAPDGRWHTIVGVVEALQMDDVGDAELPNALVPLAQNPRRFLSIVVRTHGDPAAYKTRFVEVLRTLDPDTPAYWLRTYDEVLGVAIAGERVVAGAFGAFGSIALLLAAAGLYGLVAQLVGNRIREIGVQRALGASGTRVLQTLLKRLALPLLLGLGLGLTLAVAFTRLMTQAMPTVTLDARAVLWLLLILLTTALLATWLPARRALRVDPTVALRHE